MPFKSIVCIIPELSSVPFPLLSNEFSFVRLKTIFVGLTTSTFELRVAQGVRKTLSAFMYKDVRNKKSFSVQKKTLIKNARIDLTYCPFA